MKRTKSGRRVSIQRNIGKLQRACDGAVRFDGLEERRLMTAVFTVTNNADAGTGSLREAITVSNSTPGKDSIHFAITGDTKIELASALPALTDEVSIDGTTQAGYAGTPLVWIDGSAGIDSGGTPTFAGLQVTGGNSGIRGLALTSFSGAISLSGGAGDSIAGCYIGFDPTADAPDSSYANYQFGIEVANAGSTIGGTAAGDANVISLNNDDGILVDGTGPTTIIGNRIGADATGTLSVGNGNDGIRISGASDVTIGGLVAGEQNLIVGNFGNGIEIDGGAGVRIIGNSIGQNPAATDAFLSNFGDGIAIFGVAAGATGTPQVLVDSNLVSSNFGDGIRLTDSGGVTITGNVIGSAAAPDVGVDFGNNGDGIGLEGTSSGNRIGGIGAGEGNTIAYNHGAGVAVYVANDPAASGVRNAIRGNSIHDNLSVGIDLTETPGLRGFEVFSGLGPTPNDSAETGHVGPNAYQNFPVIAGANRNSATGAVTIYGSLSATPDTDYSIDLFGNQAANSSGYGEGEHYLMSITVYTNHAGHVTFVQTVPAVDPAYAIFSATATDPNGNTSEFSAVSEAVSVGSTTTLATSLNPSVYGTSVTFTATVTGDGVGAPGGTVTFMDGASVLGTGTLNAAGVATLTTSTLSAAHHPIKAVYDGDEQYSGSNSAALVQAVTPAPLTVKVADTSKFYGQADPAFTLEYAGFVNSDAAASLVGLPLILSDGGSTAHVGAYAVSVGGLTSPNYSITFQSGTLTVNKAALTVTVNNASRAFGLANPAFPVGYGGFVNGDSAASLDGAVAFATAATAGSTVGNYSVTASGLTAADYNITYAPGTLAIVQATTTTGLSTSASSASVGQPVTFTATVAGNPGFVPSGSVTFFDNGVSLGTVALSGGVATLTTGGLAIGNHAVTATYGGSADYLASNGGPITQGVTAGLTISGTVHRDATGNGLSDDDTGLAGVTVNLYVDSDHNGVLSAPDQVVAHTVSGADGAYAFTAQPGVYFIGELTPAGYVQTGPAKPLYYTLNAASGGTAAGKDFDNFLAADCDVHDVTNVTYLINGTTVVDQLRGSVHQGDTVEVIFTVPAGEAPHQFSFVSYTAPGSTFDADNAHQQMVYDSDTDVFGPGVHTLTVTVPDAYFQVDFVCGAIIDYLGPAGSNIFYTPQGRLIGADNGGTQAPINAPSSISGFVYLDANNNGAIDLVDGVIAGVKVTLSGTDDRGKSVSMVEFTDADGRYFFGGLRPGTYSVTQTQPTGVSDGRETLGSITGSAASTFGTASNGRFSTIKLAASRDGINYNFGELGCAVQRGQTASIGFWQNSNGQALLKGLNNGSTDTNLGIWLAANFPNMYGQNAGAASLLGKTNAQIAAFYTTLYKTAAQKLDAQVLALAFSTYVTDAQLAGTVARNYGFAVSDTGVGAATYNVGANGAAFGVANNSTVAVSQLLQIADNKSWNGTLWDADRSGTLSATETGWRNMAYTVFNAINNAGGL